MSRIAALAIAGCLAALPLSAQAADMDAHAQASRAVVKQFFDNLKGELMGAMKDGGPVNAIAACKAKAPGIADTLSKEKGWTIGRTSLKLRNPDNAPDDWEKTVLEQFDTRKASGEDPTKMEHFEVVDMAGKKAFRYMKAIPTAEKPCLACHGETVDAKVEDALKSMYPDDAARGYKPGDIRGAFTISFTVE